MPRGSHHDESGVIAREGCNLSLLRENEGRWRLNAPLRSEDYIGRRMRVVGVWSGFDLLDVTSFTPVS